MQALILTFLHPVFLSVCVFVCLCAIMFMHLHQKPLNLGIRQFIFHNSVSSTSGCRSPRQATFFENQEARLRYWVLSYGMLILPSSTCSTTQRRERFSTESPCLMGTTSEEQMLEIAWKYISSPQITLSSAPWIVELSWARLENAFQMALWTQRYLHMQNYNLSLY